jgi:hypothetical protein
VEDALASYPPLGSNAAVNWWTPISRPRRWTYYTTWCLGWRGWLHTERAVPKSALKDRVSRSLGLLRTAGVDADMLERLRTLAHQTIESYEKFLETYSTSSLVPEMHRAMEPLYFARARGTNTEQSYQTFLTQYPDGELARRATGDLAYVQMLGTGPSVATLREFMPKDNLWAHIGPATQERAIKNYIKFNN